MCLMTLALPGVTTSLCLVKGILGPLLATYSLQVQCLNLYTAVRNVNSITPRNKTAVGNIQLALMSGICLAVDTCVLVYSSIVHGDVQKVSSIGYCFVTYKDVLKMVMAAFYGIKLSGSVLLCTVFYMTMTLFVRKNSIRLSLARKRSVLIFKLTFRKLVIWFLSYTLIIVRLIGYKTRWPKVTF